MASNILSKHEFWNRMKHFPAGLRDFEHLRDKLYDAYQLPEESDKKYRAELQKQSLFRNICTVMPGEMSDYNIFISNSEDSAEWVTPQTDLQEHTDEFNRIQLSSSTLSVLVKLDEDMVHEAQFDLEDHLVKRLGKAFANGEENAFINGDGNYKPFGILDDAKGAEIGRSTAAIGYEDVVKLYFSVKKEFRKDGCWLMNDVTAFTLRALKNPGGMYIWDQATNTILGKPVYISNYMPDPEQGNKPIAFGDFKRYWIIDRLPISVRVIEELFAKYGHIGYLGHEYLNGILVTPEAIKVLKLV